MLESYIGCLAEHAREITSCTQYSSPRESAHGGFSSGQRQRRRALVTQFQACFERAAWWRSCATDASCEPG